MAWIEEVPSKVEVSITRIERLWGDLWRSVTNVNQQLHTFLENESIIDCTDERHLWALHYVYLPQINQDLEVFREQWNNHGLCTVGHLTTYQMEDVFEGSLQRQTQPLRSMAEIFGSNTAQEGAPAVLALNWQKCTDAMTAGCEHSGRTKW